MKARGRHVTTQISGAWAPRKRGPGRPQTRTILTAARAGRKGPTSRSPLLLGISLHRLHPVGDEIGAPLQLHLYLRLGGVHLLVVRLDRVVPAPRQR